MSSAPKKIVALDANEAAAYVAHATNKVISIYPITFSSNMELVYEHRGRPRARCTGAPCSSAQNPDTFFQSREACRHGLQ